MPYNLITIVTPDGHEENWEGKRVLQNEYPKLELYLTGRKCDDFGNCDDPICEGLSLDPPCVFYSVTEKTTGLSVLHNRELWPYAGLTITLAQANIDRHGGQEAVLRQIAKLQAKGVPHEAL